MAQLVAHLLCKQGVRGSSPLGSTDTQPTPMSPNPPARDESVLPADLADSAPLLRSQSYLVYRIVSQRSGAAAWVPALPPVQRRRGSGSKTGAPQTMHETPAKQT